MIYTRSCGIPVVTYLLAVCFTASTAAAQKKYDPGASDTEIKIGNLMPYSGPLSAISVIGKAEAAYFKKINAEGGINGRKFEFISYDDSASPPKTVDQARKLVESDDILLLFNPIGTASSTAIQRHMNQKKVPHLFVGAGAAKFSDLKNSPWTMGWQLSYQTQSRIYAKYILEARPNAKIAILYQNDDYGKDLLKGLMDGLGPKSNMVVATESYERTDSTIDSRMISLKSSGADVFVSITSAKASVQSLKKAKELDWKPLFIMNNIGSTIGGVIAPAGYDAAQGIISLSYTKDVSDPQWANDAGVKEYDDFLKQWYPEANRLDSLVGNGRPTHWAILMPRPSNFWRVQPSWNLWTRSCLSSQRVINASRMSLPERCSHGNGMAGRIASWS